MSETTKRDARYAQSSKRSLIYMLVDLEVANEVMRTALENAKVLLDEDGCNCGDANDPPCVLCEVTAALNPETAKQIVEQEIAEFA